MMITFPCGLKIIKLGIYRDFKVDSPPPTTTTTTVNGIVLHINEIWHQAAKLCNLNVFNKRIKHR